MTEAYESNWMSTVGKNIDEVERLTSEKVGVKYTVGLSSGTAALHLAMKAIGIKRGDNVFCSDMTFAATVNPVIYEGGIPIFIDSEYDTWNMDANALEKAFVKYPQTKYVVLAHLYGTPANMCDIITVCQKHNAILIEDAAESLGATYEGKMTGSFGKVAICSGNGNKIITGSSGGMFMTDDKTLADNVRKWSTQSRDNAPWYQHTELGYNYRMSNVVAGVLRGQFGYLEEHIEQKRLIYERYKKSFADLPIDMNPLGRASSPNYWLSCMTIRDDAMCEQSRSDSAASFMPQHNKSCPTEILGAISACNAEGRPIWKPMHMQPIYGGNQFVDMGKNVGEDIFNRGLCLPSDNKMTTVEQDKIIEAVRACFD